MARAMIRRDRNGPGGDPGLRSLQWESWIAQWTFGTCGGTSGLAADFDKDSDIDLNDLLIFDALAKEGSPAADFDKSGKVDTDDLKVMLEAVGEQP
jgi:hypothetical protein